jgi:hypothetical protein
MTRSRTASLLEAGVDVAAGFGLAILGLHPTLPQNLRIGLIAAGSSLVRREDLRRLFPRRPGAGSPRAGGR